MEGSAESREQPAPGKPLVVFLSYSRKDEGVVRKFRRLGRAFGVVPWRDDDDIPPGHAWPLEIAQAISQCERMLVFWCRHSSDSDEVRREYGQGLDSGKLVVPVLMDKTPLPARLKLRHAVDVSGLLWLQHEIMRLERLSWILIPLFGLLALIGFLT